MIDSEVSILIVDDDEVDRGRSSGPCVSSGSKIPSTRRATAARGWRCSAGKRARTKVPRPYLILLDLNMPRMNGLQFLTELRGDSSLSDSIVFVLTTSRDEEDRAAAYRQHIAGYLQKPAYGMGSGFRQRRSRC